jgi:hypothetical protein
MRGQESLQKAEPPKRYVFRASRKSEHVKRESIVNVYEVHWNRNAINSLPRSISYPMKHEQHRHICTPEPMNTCTYL